MLVYVTCELFAAFMCISSHAGSARKEKKRLLSIINRHLKHTPVFVGLLVQWLLRYVNLIAAGRMSDEVICFRCCCFFGLSTEIFGARYLYSHFMDRKLWQNIRQQQKRLKNTTSVSAAVAEMSESRATVAVLCFSLASMLLLLLPRVC